MAVMHEAVLWAAAFGLTFAETAIATFESRADRQATACKDNRFSLKAAHWATAFEIVLLIDIYILVRSPWIVVPIAAGAWIGKYAACERRRKKFRRRASRKRTTTPPTTE